MKKIFLLVGFLIFTANLFPQNYPGSDIIGKGYDIFGEFADNRSIKMYPIFDFSTAEKRERNGYQMPKPVFLQNIMRHKINIIEGRNITEYVSKLNKSLSLNYNAFLFKAGFENKFFDKKTTEDKILYYTYMDISEIWKVSLDRRYYKQYLDKDFKRDLETMDPKDLFDFYGTHFIAAAYIGGRADYSAMVKIHKEEDIERVTRDLEVKFKKLQGGQGNYEFSSDKNSSTILSTKLTVIGGESRYTTNINNSEQYREWAESVTNYPVLCNFDATSLVPIWELTDNEVRKKELKDYFYEKILPEYPLPRYYDDDDILNSTDLTENFEIYIPGFRVIQNCEGTSEDGEFLYRFSVNDKVIAKTMNSPYTKDTRMCNKAYDGDFVELELKKSFKVPYKKNSQIKVTIELAEIDSYTDNEVLPVYSQEYYFPFSFSSLYNYPENDPQYFKVHLVRSSECIVDVFYRIEKQVIPQAIEYGNKGWYAFLEGDYDTSLEFYRKALELDNTLWYVHFNVGLLFLAIQDPRAYDKYKFALDMCNDKETIETALKDIVDYESKNGRVSGSDKVKQLFKYKLVEL